MQQQTKSHIEKARNNRLTPTDKLLADKIDLEEKCRLQEKKLNEDFNFIKDNATSLILSGISTLLFPSKTDQQTTPTSTYGVKNAAKNPAISVSDYIAIARNLFPVAWGLIQPIIITWGLKKTKSYIFSFFSSRQRTNNY